MTGRWINNSLINPEPILVEETDLLVNDFLSVNKLQELTGQSDLNEVETLEMVAKTTETTLGNFGQYLPNLVELKLSDSLIPTVRDIGTSFNRLKILWMARCGLNDIDGIASMQNLQELYIAYNNIEDISPISFLDSLEVLDIEGNKIVEIEQIDYLSIMSCLTTLTLTGNPVCHTFKQQTGKTCTYREYILEKLPNLQQLDDKSSSSTEVGSVQAATTPSREDMEIISNAIKEGLILDVDEKISDVDSANSSIDSPTSEPQQSSPFSDFLPSSFSMSPTTKFNIARPSTAASPRRPLGSTADRLMPLFPNSRPNSSGSESGLQLDELSKLTFGDPLCGNPIQALRKRKKAPLPVMSVLNQDFDLNQNKTISRPATSLGLRRPMKALKDSYDFEDRIKHADTFNLNNLESSLRSCLDENSRGASSEMKSATQKESTSSFGSEQKTSPQQATTSTAIRQPTPPASDASSFRTPTPPRSPQQPQSAHDYRTTRLRRSFSSGGSHSVNIMTLHSVANQHRIDPALSRIEDQSS